MIERRRTRSPDRIAGRRSNRPATARSTSLISSDAKAAPTQRRVPPPNGMKVYGSGAPSRKRSGLKAVGSSQTSPRRCAR